MLPRKRALARAGHADQHDEGKLWDGEFHSAIVSITPAFYPQGPKARKKIAQGKASPGATPWVSRPKDFQALKGRQIP